MPKDNIYNEAYLLLGSNLGDKAINLQNAIWLLEQRAGTVARSSSLYATQPWHMETDEWFLNRVVKLLTLLEPKALLQTTLDIESELGRHRNEETPPGHYTSRTIDIDILYYNDLVLETKQLILPHPRIEARRFTLVPLCEIAPGHVHPVLLKTQEALLETCEDHSVVTKVEL